MQKEQLCRLEGSVDSVIYKNEANGFAVLTLDSGGEPVTVVGELGNVDEGEELSLTGEYINHKKFGMQFKAHLCERALPQTASAIQKYLASGVIKGVGPVFAKKIVMQFGENSLEVLENAPERLCEVEGITKRKANKISEEFKRVFGVRSLMVYLAKYGISASVGVRAWKKWGNLALEVINRNPYALCCYETELPFEKAEEIAHTLNISDESESRIKAGVFTILLENSFSGHTCLPLDRLKSKTCEMLDISDEDFDRIIESEHEENNFIMHTKKNRNFVFLKEYHVAEDYIANRISLMKRLMFNNTINYDEVINIDEHQHGIKYESLQRKAINESLSKGLMILTGGPGTGKTTTLNAIISLFEQQGERVLIAAPTGRAAKRISDLTGYDARTIHRMLDMQASPEKSGESANGNGKYIFSRNESNPLECDVMIIDEMSMVDVLLFEALLRALPLDCKLIMVGDSDQLPSVGAGNVLKDLIDSKIVPVIQLKEIFRQAQNSSIIINAHKIISGEIPDLSKKDSDFFFFQRLEFETAAHTVIELVKERLPKAYGYSATDDIQILTPTRKGPLGVIELNNRLQQELNPSSSLLSELKMFRYTFRENDKVMQTKNNYDILWKRGEESGSGVFNGDIGKILEVNKASETIKADFDGRICVYNSAMLEDLELAYAVTVHKSQGSEFDVVILPLLGGFDKLYFRNLLYTAVTRAKKMLVIVGSTKRLEYMINNNRRTRRYSCLKDMLVKEAGGNIEDS